MKKSNKFSPEVRERAVRLVQEHRGEYPSLWAAIESIAPKIGCLGCGQSCVLLGLSSLHRPLMVRYIAPDCVLGRGSLNRPLSVR